MTEAEKRAWLDQLKARLNAAEKVCEAVEALPSTPWDQYRHWRDNGDVKGAEAVNAYVKARLFAFNAAEEWRSLRGGGA